MSDQHQVDESNLEDSDLNIENQEGSDENDTSEEKSKNPSNFKKLYKKSKAQDKEIAELKAQLKEATHKKESDAVLDDADDAEKLRLDIFGIKHPEAQGSLAEILTVSKAHNMDLDTAWKFLKATTPKESESYDDFEIKGKKAGGSIDYKSMSLDESAKLSPEERKKWRQANGW